MIVIGCGGPTLVLSSLDRDALVRNFRSERVRLLFHGGSRGADTEWRMAAQAADVPNQVTCYPQWHVFGCSSNSMRNVFMLDLARTYQSWSGMPMELWVLPGVNGSLPGSNAADLVRRAEAAQIKVRRFEVNTVDAATAVGGEA